MVLVLELQLPPSVMKWVSFIDGRTAQVRGTLSALNNHYSILTLRDHLNDLNAKYKIRLTNSQIFQPFLNKDFLDRDQT